MISKVVLKKLIAVTVVGSVSVGYVAYQSFFDNMEGEGKKDDYNTMIDNIGMFSVSYVSGSSSLSGGYGKAKENDRSSDDMSLLGSSGSYGHSRVGKVYK